MARAAAELPFDLRPVPRGLDLVRAYELADGLWCLRLPLRCVVCTHMHADHAGLAATVIERTGCTLLRGLGPHGRRPAA